MKKRTFATLFLSLFCLSTPIVEAQTQNCCGPNHWIFQADFLYWATDFNAISQLGGIVVPDDGVDVTLNIGHPGQKWDPGVRLSAGWASCDNWDLQASWTHFYNRNQNSGTPFTLVVGPNILDTTGSSRFTFQYNVVDLDLGTTLCLNPCLLIHPFVGVHAIWFERTSRLGLDVPQEEVLVGFDMNHRSWGVGPRLGVNSLWGNWMGLGIVGNINGALVYGKHRSNINVDVSVGTDVAVHLVDNPFWQLMSTFQIQSGLSYLGCFCNNEFRINALWECNMINQATEILIFDRAISTQGLTLSLEYLF